MKYVIYTRASTDKDNSISHEMQLGECMAIVKDAPYLHFKEDDVSGDVDLDKRPELVQAINSLKRGDVLIVWRLARLTRFHYTLGAIMSLVAQKGATIFSVSEPNYFENNAESELQRTIAAAIAKYELETIRLNVRRSMQSMKKAGRVVGNIPYGYESYDAIEAHNGKPKRVRYLRENPAEQEVLNLMLKLKEEGLAYREIADALKERGILHRSGRPLTFSAVYRILKNHAIHKKVSYRRDGTPPAQTA